MKKIKIILTTLIVLTLFTLPTFAASDNFFTLNTRKTEDIEVKPITEDSEISNHSNRTDGIWKRDTAGWWYEYKDGSYPRNKWVMINQNWYYFDGLGYMAHECYQDGFWIDDDGICRSNYPTGQWIKNDTGWWYEDNGWYPVDKFIKIDGSYYYFNEYEYLKE